jgi:hypothetical protein
MFVSVGDDDVPVIGFCWLLVEFVCLAEDNLIVPQPVVIKQIMMI